MELRPYQDEVVFKCRSLVPGDKVIVVAPTGAGKTVIGAAIIEQARAKRMHIVVLAHTREIIKQTSEKLFAYDVNHGVIQAGYPTRPNEPVQVASIQTLWARAMRGKRMDLPPADMLVIDECHHCPANTYREIIKAYPDAVLIGLTATPCRGDGRGLGGIFDQILECPQVGELIEQKHLVRTRVFAPINPDLKGTKTRGGDYVETQLALRMDRTDLIGDIVSTWHKYGERRKTVCFAVSVAHSLHIRDEFQRSGVRAAHVDGSISKADRDTILWQLGAGDLDLVTNCMVLTEGWDMPEVSCCILARPTKKMGLYRQMVGRVLRPTPGKYNAIILDHSGAIYQHGFIEDPVKWTLNPCERAYSPKHAARLRSGYSSRFIECAKCRSIRVAGEACRCCGFLPQRSPRSVSFKNGDLSLVDRNTRAAEPLRDPHQRMRWHAMLSYIAVRGRLPARVGSQQIPRKIWHRAS